MPFNLVVGGYLSLTLISVIFSIIMVVGGSTPNFLENYLPSLVLAIKMFFTIYDGLILGVLVQILVNAIKEVL